MKKILTWLILSAVSAVMAASFTVERFPVWRRRNCNTIFS